MSKSIFEYRLEVLLKEWDFAQGQIGQFDSIAMTIRGWAVSVFSAMLAAAIALHNADLCLWTMMPIILFWLLDALFKSFQELVIDRSRKIEDYLRSKEFAADAASQMTFGFETPQIAGLFQADNRERTAGLLRAALYANVSFFYGALLVTCIVLYYLLPSLMSADPS